MIKVSDLWWCLDPKAWNEALKRYWDFVQPKNLVLERSLDKRKRPAKAALLKIRAGAKLV